VRPSGRLPSVRSKPCGSLELGIPAEAKTRATIIIIIIIIIIGAGGGGSGGGGSGGGSDGGGGIVSAYQILVMIREEG